MACKCQLVRQRVQAANGIHRLDYHWLAGRDPFCACGEQRAQCGQAERKAAIKTANQILNDNQPYNFGFASNKLLGVSKKVQNVNPGPFARYGQAKPETWWIQ